MTTITKVEMKNLLKRRSELLHAHSQLENNMQDNETVNGLYKNGISGISDIIYTIDKQLLEYAKSSPVGEWLLQIKGITPHLAAAVLVYFDIENKECAAQFISYAGLDNKNKPHSDIGCIVNTIKNNFKSQSDGLYKKIYKEKYLELMQDDIETITAKIRAGRFAMKVFIGHVFEEMYREAHDGKLPNRYDTDSIIIEPEIPYTK